MIPILEAVETLSGIVFVLSLAGVGLSALFGGRRG